MKDILKISAYSGLGTMVILALFQPFGIDRIEEGRLLFILGQAVIVFFCVGFSIGILNWICPKFVNQKATSFWRTFLLMLPMQGIILVLLPALLMSYISWFHYETPYYAWFDSEGSFTMKPYLSMMIPVAIVTIFIVLWLSYMVRNRELKDELKEIKLLNQLLEERREMTESTETEAEEQEPQTCTLVSSTNNTSLEVNPENIIYIESMSNYADICYLDNDQTCHKTLRITMKQLRASLADAQCLVSCHRAFMVNVNFIVSISTRPTGGYQLQIFGQDTPIPVARAYTEEIKAKINK